MKKDKKVGINHWYGRKHSEVTRKRMSEAQKGNQNAKGMKHSEESKRKISEAHKGRKRSEEYKKKMSEACKGRKFSEATKKKIGLSSTGRKHTEVAKKKMSEAIKKQEKKAPNIHPGKAGKKWSGRAAIIDEESMDLIL